MNWPGRRMGAITQAERSPGDRRVGATVSKEGAGNRTWAQLEGAQFRFKGAHDHWHTGANIYIARRKAQFDLPRGRIGARGHKEVPQNHQGKGKRLGPIDTRPAWFGQREREGSEVFRKVPRQA